MKLVIFHFGPQESLTQSERSSIICTGSFIDPTSTTQIVPVGQTAIPTRFVITTPKNSISAGNLRLRS
jgi:hypothetical protein